MCIQLRRIDRFEEAIVNFIHNHPDAYNGDENLTVGVDVPDDSYLYNICDGENKVGFFFISIKDDIKGYGHEIEIGIFDEYQRGNFANESQSAPRYGTTCLRNFQTLVPDWEELTKDDDCIYACVRANNRLREHIERMLCECRFISMNEEIEKIEKFNIGNNCREERNNNEESINNSFFYKNIRHN
ncbi:MAG: hypothetical protein Q4E64_05940 [Phascolarctobacterium sp.]|uniref:hypothetical protein n=1 Tax=Phascolarctobacterium sp. TaxID=2049039 RepID=UPI0026DD01CE|nr:hypothetical protein [Phascolarctobacterium sp.]MDO4921345.1 hypothetical protein [Phascolarctobacterium sp.]